MLAGAKWRDQALVWLRADLDTWGQVLAANAKAVAETLAHWQKDADLAPIRDAEDLPDDFKQLWVDVDALLKRAQELVK